MSTLSNPQRLLLGICFPLLAVFVGLSTWFGLRAAWGNANTLHASWVVYQWRQNIGPVVTSTMWLRMRDELLEGTKTTPDNAQLYDDLGYLYATRAWTYGKTLPDTDLGTYQRKLYSDAIVSYRTATSLRPTFPYSWVYFSRAKMYQGHIDDEMWFAFDKAMQLGTAEATVRLVLVEIACAQWTSLTDTRKEKVGNLLSITPTHHRAPIAALIKATNCPATFDIR